MYKIKNQLFPENGLNFTKDFDDIIKRIHRHKELIFTTQVDHVDLEIMNVLQHYIYDNVDEWENERRKEAYEMDRLMRELDEKEKQLKKN